MIIIKQVHSHNKVLNKLRKCQKEENEVKLPHIQNNLYLEDLTPLHDEVNMSHFGHLATSWPYILLYAYYIHYIAVTIFSNI